MTPGNRYTYAVFINNGHIYSEWGGGRIFSLSIGCLAKEYLLFYPFISSFMPSNTFTQFALRLNMGVVNWAGSLLQLTFCECQKLLWIRTWYASSQFEDSLSNITESF